MKATKVLMIMSAVLPTCLLLSCEHKEIVCPAGVMREISVSYDWRSAPEASPEGMTLYFYPEQSYGRIWRYDIAGRDGGAIEIPAGRYRMVTFNNDLSGIDVTGTEDYHTISAQARRLVSNDGTMPPGMLYCTTVSDVEVTLCGVKYTTSGGETKECGMSVVRCYPDSTATAISVVAPDVKGISRIKSASCRLKGPATGYLFADGVCTGDITTTFFTIGKDVAGTGLETMTTAFAPIQSPQSAYTLSLVVTLTDGTTLLRNYDVTQEFMNPLGRHFVLIEIKGLEIPETGGPPEPGGDIGGIDVDVDGWTVIDIDIES